MITQNQQLYINPFKLCFQNGESALHAASLFGHLKVVKELVKAGAKVDLKNKVCCCLVCYIWL